MLAEGTDPITIVRVAITPATTPAVTDATILAAMAPIAIPTTGATVVMATATVQAATTMMVALRTVVRQEIEEGCRTGDPTAKTIRGYRISAKGLDPRVGHQKGPAGTAGRWAISPGTATFRPTPASSSHPSSVLIFNRS